MSDPSAEQLLQEKEYIIQQLQLQVQQLLSPNQTLTFPLSSRPQKKAMKTKSIQFLSTLVGNSMTINFPKADVAPTPDLLQLRRQGTISSELTYELGNLDKLLNEKIAIQAEISEREFEIRQECEAKISALKASYMQLLYRPQLSPLDSQIQEIGNRVLDTLESCILMSPNSLATYIVESRNVLNNELYLQQLTDSFGMPFETPKGVYKKITDLAGSRVIPTSELTNFYNEMEGKMVKVYYQLIDIGEAHKLCCPVHIEPSGLSLNDYEIKVDNSTGQITQVNNREEGPVKFITTHVDEDAGLVMESIIEIYTQQINEHILNISHVHVEDMGDEIPIEVVYILDSQSWQEYTDFSADARGIQLRYKILIKSGEIYTVLYNIGEQVKQVAFVETRLRSGEYVRLHNSGEIAQIQQIPTGMLGRDWQGQNVDIQETYLINDPLDFCHSRYVEELPGLIDVKIVSANGQLIENGACVALPICLLDRLNARETNDLLQQFNSIEQEKKSKVVEKLQRIQEMVQHYNSGTVSDKQAFLTEFSSNLSDVRKVVNEDESLRSTWADLLRQGDRVARALTMDIRYG